MRSDQPLPQAVQEALHFERTVLDEPPTGSPILTMLHLNQELMRKRQLTPPMLRKALAARTRGQASVLSSESASIEWFLLVRFHHLPEMLAHGGLAREQEGMLSDSAMRVLMDTLAISGHPDVNSATAGVADRLSAKELLPTEERVVHAYGSCLADVAAVEDVCVEVVEKRAKDKPAVAAPISTVSCVSAS